LHAIHHFQTAFYRIGRTRAPICRSACHKSLMNANYIERLKKAHFPPRKLLDKPPDDYPHELRRPPSPGPMSSATGGADMTA
jgi:hypothetical protein